MALQGKLGHPKRFITTHNEQGQSVVVDNETMSEDAPFYTLPDGEVGLAQCYVTKGFPVNLSDDGGDGSDNRGADFKVYQNYMKEAPGLTVSDGTVLRYVDIPPASTSAMHRTVSLDYGVVLEGEVELILDSGETRQMKRGDVCIQRATMHAWRNCSATEWGRMLYILQPCQPFSIAGQEVKEDYGSLKGVLRDSS